MTLPGYLEPVLHANQAAGTIPLLKAFYKHFLATNDIRIFPKQHAAGLEHGLQHAPTTMNESIRGGFKIVVWKGASSRDSSEDGALVVEPSVQQDPL